MPAGGQASKAAPFVGCNLVRFRGKGTPRVEGHEPVAFRDLYTLDQEPLGEGRYSRVYAATHRLTGARRAVKTAMRKGAKHMIEDYGMECPARLAIHEASILRLMDHPSVIRLHEVHDEENVVHLVLELCEGADVLERILSNSGRLPETEIANMFVQMLAGVWHVHAQGAAHRDLKPEHFLFTRREPDRLPAPPWRAAVKLIDFGLGHQELIGYKPGGGTPQFMPPEAIAGGKIVDVQALAKAMAGDMWSLGVILHAMLVGHYPSPKLSDKTMPAYLKKPAWQNCSADCLDMMGSLLKQKPDERPTSAGALRHNWSRAAERARGSVPPSMLQELPRAVQEHVASPGLVRLALRAIACEIDDFEVFEVRLLFQLLVTECGGDITADTLRQMASGSEDLRKVAPALGQEFEKLHGSAQGAVLWSEFLAMVLAGAHLAKSSLSATARPLLSDETVFSAFDRLRYDTPTVSGATLALLCPPASSRQATAEAQAEPEAARFAALVRQVCPSGAVAPEDFLDLVTNPRATRAKVPAAGPGRPSKGFFGCLCGSKSMPDESEGGTAANQL
mmetsp:Transcript_68868/g.180487  ORF Transcript_68868/g.180487 Transcript_68868/m.180487 type:complete len:563 (+) Transcript_68868:183-1871(+)